jgi:hypothetical protein
MKPAVRSSSLTALVRRALGAAIFVAAVAASSHAVSAQFVKELARPGTPLNIPLVHTPKSFGIPMGSLTVASQTVHAGPFVCSVGFSNCGMTGAEIPDQEDPAVRAWLMQYVIEHYGQSVTWSEPQFNIGPTTMTAAQFVGGNQLPGGIEGFGCYISTITMLENAALAHLPSTVHPSGRAKVFADLALASGPNANPHPELPDLSADQRRLLWQYERWADKLQPNKANPSLPSQPDFLELSEFAADVPTASTNVFNVPSLAQASDARLEQLMRAGHYLGLAFSRWAVEPVRGSHSTVGFTEKSLHKVVVAGFDTKQKYPIIIGDVGIGAPRRVRIVQLKDLTFKLSGVAASMPKVDHSKLAPNQLVLLYEGTGTNFSQGDQVLMIDAMFDMTAPTGPST